MTGITRLVVVPLELAEANALVDRWHRHHRPVVGHRFSIGVADQAGEVRGAAIVGRPVARARDDGWTVEVTRLVTDGTPNACSALYSAAWRAARAMGYRRIGTYTLASDPAEAVVGAGVMAGRSVRIPGAAGGGPVGHSVVSCGAGHRPVPGHPTTSSMMQPTQEKPRMRTKPVPDHTRNSGAPMTVAELVDRLTATLADGPFTGTEPVLVTGPAGVCTVESVGWTNAGPAPGDWLTIGVTRSCAEVDRRRREAAADAIDPDVLDLLR